VKRLAALVAVLFLAACASSSADSPVEVRIADTNITSDIRYAGPVAIRFHVEVMNPTNENLKLRKIEIHSAANGAFSVKVTNNYDRDVAPAQTIALELNATGNSTGGRLAPDEPITFRGTAFFDSPHGAFVKLFSDVSRIQ